MAKFKVGDIITIADQSDPLYKKRGYYKILHEYEDGYDLFSFKMNKKLNKELIRSYVVGAYLNLNLKNWFNLHYRLATKEEILLFVNNYTE